MMSNLRKSGRRSHGNTIEILEESIDPQVYVSLTELLRDSKHHLSVTKKLSIIKNLLSAVAHLDSVAQF